MVGTAYREERRRRQGKRHESRIRSRKGAIQILLMGMLLGGALLAPSVGIGSHENAPARELVDKALRQLNLALQQAVLAQLRPSPAEVQIHAQVVLNLLQGRNGPDYNVATAPDPGDGIGVIPYVEQLQAEPVLQGESNESLQLNLENVLSYLQQAVDYAKMALNERSLTQAHRQMRQALAFLSAAKGREQEITVAGGLLVLRARLASPAERPGSQQSER